MSVRGKERRLEWNVENIRSKTVVENRIVEDRIFVATFNTSYFRRCSRTLRDFHTQPDDGEVHQSHRDG